MSIVLTSSGLPANETGFRRISSFTRHRCDLTAVGVSRETHAAKYHFNNTERKEGCLFQYTFAGEGRFQVLPDGKPVTLPPGTGFLVDFPSPSRYWLEPGTPWEFCYVMLDGDMAHDRVQQLIRQHGHIWTLPSTHSIIELIRSLHLRVFAGEVPDEFESAAIAHHLLMELFRAKRNPDRTHSPAVGRAAQLMESQYGNPDLTMDQIANASGYSRYHLSRLFKNETGSSPYAYLQKIRIQRALHLITTTRLPVKQVAFNSGYRDVAHFCKEFKRRTHKTPLTLRQMGAQLNLSTIHVG